MMDLNNAVPLLESLKEYVALLWGQFDLLERKAVEKSETQDNDYKAVTARPKNGMFHWPLMRFDGSAKETFLSPWESFRTHVLI